MSNLIKKLSLLMPKQRFDELQSAARQTCYRYFENDGEFGLIYDDVEDAISDTAKEYVEQEKMLLHFMIARNIDLYGKGEELTDVKWAHPGFMGTAEKGDTIQ